MQIRVLSLTQPWAAMVAVGAKQIETRSWQTAYRGPLAIHAAKGLASIGGLAGLADICQQYPFSDAMQAAGLAAADLPLGAIVATCTLVGCYRIVKRGGQPGYMLAEPFREFVPVTSPEFDMGDYSIQPKQRYAWLLADVRRLATPILVSGKQRIWKYELPDGIAYA